VVGAGCYYFYRRSGSGSGVVYFQTAAGIISLKYLFYSKEGCYQKAGNLVLYPGKEEIILVRFWNTYQSPDNLKL